MCVWDAGALDIADARLSLKDMKISIPVFKPKDQLTTALNKLFVEQDRDAKYYTTVFCSVTALLPTAQRKIRENDIFNGSVPVRLYIMYSARDNYNGTYATNCFHFPWHHFSNISVSVNSICAGVITNKKQAYAQLRDVLNRKYSEMPITYEQFIGGYGIIANITMMRITRCKII